MAIDIIGSYRKWSLLTAPPIILGGIVDTVIVCDFLFRKTVPDEAVTKCTSCGTDFSAFVRKHHCRNCGDIFCDKCTHGRIALTTDENASQVRVCDRCMAEVTHRLSNTKEADSRSVALKSHEDLAKKLQDIDVCYAFVEFEDIAGVQNAIKIKKHGKQADILVQLDALGLKIIQVTADGNCFFRALADQLEGNEDEHMKYRIMVVDFIRKNRETYEPFIEDEVPFDEYCQSMEKDGTWAGHMEIQAASLVTHSNICIHQKMSPRWYIQNFDNREAQMIHLSYHDEEHYNSVRLKEDTCSGAARPVTIKADVDISTKSHQTKVSVTKSKGKADKNIIQAGSVKMVMVGSGCENYQKAEQVLLLMPQFLITEQGSEESLVENDNFSFSAGISHGENQNDNPVPHKAEVDDNTEKRGQSCDNIERTRDNNILQQFEKRIIPSRNKACPCGSKKKYKSCCGSVAGRSSAKFAINQTVDYGEGRKNKKQGKKSGANNVANSHVSEGEPPDVGALCI